MALKLDKFGGKRFKANWEAIESEVNQNAPVNGTGIKCDVTPAGTQINQDIPTTEGGAASGTLGGSGGGSSIVSLYGAFNGQPALYHLKQSSEPTPFT